MRDRFSVARRSGHGHRRQRLLVVGDRLYVNASPQTPGSIEDLSSALTGASLRDGLGVDLDVLWDLGPAMRAIGDGTSSRQLWRYDAVVVVVARPAARSPLLRLQALLLQVVAELASTSRMVLVFASPATRTPDGRRSRHRAMRLIQQLDAAGHRIPSLPAEIDEDGHLVDPGTLAAGILGLLTTDLADRDEVRSGPEAEPSRQAAVDRSLETVTGPSVGMERAVLLARNSFEVPYAQINLLDHGRLRSLASAGRTSHDLRHTLSGLVAATGRPLLIPDSRDDPAYDAIEETRGPDGIRFYVGWPIRSWDGYCIGALCVFDTSPHDIEPTDSDLARDLAQLAEAEILALTGAT